jgi:O-antigen ligase
MFSFKKDTIIKYLITLLPFSLVFSIFITEIFLILISIFYFYEIRKENLLKLISLNFSYLGIFLCIYFLYVSLNSIFLENEFFLRNTIFYFRFYFYFLSILFFINKLNIYNLILKSFFTIFIILILDATFQLIFGFNTFGIPIIVENRMSSFFGDELVLGSYITRLAPFFLIFIFVFKENFFFRLFCLTSLVYVVILSGERTALFLLFLNIFFVFVVIKKLRLHLFYIIGFSLICFVALININSSYYERYYLNIINNLGINHSKDDAKIDKLSIFDNNNNLSLVIFSKHHQDHYESAYKIFKKNLLIGGGTKSYRYLCKKSEYKISSHSCATHPHNIAIQFLSELGALGFVFLIFFHVLISRDLINIIKLQNYEKPKLFLIISLVGLIINIFPLIPSGNFFNNWLSVIFTLNLVNYIYLRQKYLND